MNFFSFLLSLHLVLVCRSKKEMNVLVQAFSSHKFPCLTPHFASSNEIIDRYKNKSFTEDGKKEKEEGKGEDGMGEWKLRLSMRREKRN